MFISIDLRLHNFMRNRRWLRQSPSIILTLPNFLVAEGPAFASVVDERHPLQIPLRAVINHGDRPGFTFWGLDGDGGCELG